MEIDRKTLKALAADTRLDILKALGKRRKMPSELSKELNLATSTVIEHLNKLEDADLVRREETGHKWIYYALTPKGEGLIKPRYPVHFVLVLSIALLVIFAAGFVVYTDYTGFKAATPALSVPIGQEATRLPATTAGTAQIVKNFVFHGGTGDCGTGDEEIEINGTDDKIKFVGYVTTPNPCYKLEGSYSGSDYNITIEINSKKLEGVCIQCIGSISFNGYLEVNEGRYNVKMIYNNRTITEEEVDVT